MMRNNSTKAVRTCEKRLCTISYATILFRHRTAREYEQFQQHTSYHFQVFVAFRSEAIVKVFEPELSLSASSVKMSSCCYPVLARVQTIHDNSRGPVLESFLSYDKCYSTFNLHRVLQATKLFTVQSRSWSVNGLLIYVALTLSVL